MVPSLALKQQREKRRARDGATAVAALALAVLIDALLGEPPNVVHPVAGLGRMIGVLEARAPHGRAAQLAYGTGLACLVPLCAAGAGLMVERSVRTLALPWRCLALATALKPAFALRALIEASERVCTALAAGDLARARCAAGALVSRPTAALDEPLLAAATIESLAENLTDSVLAPLLAFAACGLPGAYAYRAVNTLDSMIGYRGAFEWLGKAAARLDDVANLVPARLGAALIAYAARSQGTDGTAVARVTLREHGRTASPNAGWTMAAAAGALGVRLEKVDHYVLNPAGSPPARNDIARAEQLVRRAAFGGAALAAAAAWWVRRS